MQEKAAPATAIGVTAGILFELVLVSRAKRLGNYLIAWRWTGAGTRNAAGMLQYEQHFSSASRDPVVPAEREPGRRAAAV